MTTRDIVRLECPVELRGIEDGDHRLSRPHDINILEQVSDRHTHTHLVVHSFEFEYHLRQLYGLSQVCVCVCDIVCVYTCSYRH